MKEVTIMTSTGQILDEIECDSFRHDVFRDDVLYTCHVSEELVAQFWLMDRIVVVTETLE